MARTALCPVLIRRDDQLAALEDALFASHRGEGRFVVLAGEAGIGKTRLASELATRARKLGCDVLSGACSEAELSLPYLPFVEAIGNYLASHDLGALAARLGPSRAPLAQLFPQLGESETAERSGDPAQAKLRLFEAIVSLLTLAASERTLLLVIEDVHWADESTLGLLDHLARRLGSLSVLVLVTYRSDELHRRHPFVPTLTAWRRSGVAEMVELEPLPPAGIAEMIAAILGSEEIDRELGALMYSRTEGNPFVLEEMLRETAEPDLADATRHPLGPSRIPETVRETILLRLARLDAGHAAVLEAAAILGRTFDYPTLLAVSAATEAVVQSALAAAISQQLVEEDADGTGRYSWRHALTQEAIYTETVTPRRQAVHARAAEALSSSGSARPVELANHLLGAGRFKDAVPVCLRSAEEAERAAAFREAISMLERALPHIEDPVERGRVLCRIGEDHWLNGESATGERFLEEGIGALDELGEHLEAARYRIAYGRCLWEGAKVEPARTEYLRAREVLEPEGPSAELALAYMRLAGLDAFELDYRGCLEHSERAVEIAERAGADFERVWSLGFLGLGYLDSGDHERGFEVLDACYREAAEKGYWFIAMNMTYNDVWTRVHMLQGDLEPRLDRFSEEITQTALNASGRDLLASNVKRVRGDLRGARAEAERSLQEYRTLGFQKMAWRCQVQLAEVFTELARFDEAEEVLPPASSRTELQDIVYDACARARLRLGRGELEEAVALGREILANAEALAVYRETLAVGAEALIAAGELDAAAALVEVGAKHPTRVGLSYVDEMRARLALARGDGAGVLEPATAAIQAAREVGYPLVELRRRIVRAEALAATGGAGEAQRELREVVEEADRREARLIRSEAEAAAARHGVELPPAREEREETTTGPEVLARGERLVTSLFADVRGSTELTASQAPGDAAERMAIFYRFAKSVVERNHGIVDKFAGDAVMATFNVRGARVDHCIDALEAALALRDKAALIDLPIGVGIAVGPAVLGTGASDANIAVRGEATNLAARLQAAATAGEIVLSDEAHRRVQSWLGQRAMSAEPESLSLKGFGSPQMAYRLASPVAAGADAGETELAGLRASRT